jgi:hypothetical protein
VSDHLADLEALLHVAVERARVADDAIYEAKMESEVAWAEIYRLRDLIEEAKAATGEPA